MVIHLPQVIDSATLQGLILGADAAHNITIFKQLVGLLLIIDPNIQQNTLLYNKGFDRIKKPGGKAISIKSHCYRRVPFVNLLSHLAEQIILQPLDLKIVF